MDLIRDFYVRPFVVVFSVFFMFFLYLRLSYDNFGSYSVRRYSLDETDRSGHPGYTKVVIKPITSSILFASPADYPISWREKAT